VVVDCDPGIDDALALVALAELSRRGRFAVPCVTAVAGNARVELTARNAAFVLDRTPLRGTPVLAGGGRDGGREAGRPPRHGADGLGGLAGEVAADRWSPGAVSELARQVGRADTTILALGPLTNVAAALPSPGGRVVAMGGSLGGTGEFNFAADPLAARRVLGSGLEVTVVPIEVTGEVRFGRDVRAAAGDSLVGALLAAGHERHGPGRSNVHDAVAVIVLAHPELARSVRGRVSVEGGCLCLEPDPSASCEVVVEVDARAVAGRLVELWSAGA
jgi:inosine-uridine nucleoside N-ribohydrolase